MNTGRLQIVFYHNRVLFRRVVVTRTAPLVDTGRLRIVLSILGFWSDASC